MNHQPPNGPHADFADPWADGAGGEAYADVPYDEGGAVPGSPLLISPALVYQLSAAAQVIDGFPALEIVMSLLRDYELAGAACPAPGFDVLGWQNEITVAVRADRPGRWTSFSPTVGAHQPLPFGDGATSDLGQHEPTAVWRFIPENLGPYNTNPINIWAYVFVNGGFVPFDELVASPHYIDANGAARVTAQL